MKPVNETAVVLRTTPCGYQQVDPLPSQDDLHAYYQEQYFAGNNNAPYAASYSQLELEWRLLDVREIGYLFPRPGTLLDVGCGEGFVLSGLADRGWTTLGVDYTSEGLEYHNPALRDQLMVGDVFDVLDGLAGHGLTFDLVTCNHVLEHVREPETLLRLMHPLVADGGSCRIMVPNDGSYLQEEIVRMGHARENYWMRPPAHLNYFTVPSLVETLEVCGWKTVDVMCQFPIDVFLMNQDSNYEADTQLGANCHTARMMFDLAVEHHSLEGLLAFRRGCARANVGRDIIIYAQPDQRTE